MRRAAAAALLAAVLGVGADAQGTPGNSTAALEHAEVFAAQRERADRIAALTVTTALLGGFGPGPLPGMRLAVAAQMCDPFYADPEARYPPALAPAEFLLPDAPHTALNTLLGNGALLLVVTGVTAVLGWAIGRKGRWGGAFRQRVQHYLTFPAVQVRVVQFLYQSTALAAADLLVHSGSAWEVILGLVCAALLLVFPALLFISLRGRVPRLAGVHVGHMLGQAGEREKQWLTFFCGPGEWVGSSAYNAWLDRWGCLLRPYTEASYLWSVVEFAAAAACAGIHVARPDTMAGCGAVKTAAGVLFLFLLAAEITAQPHLHPRNSAANMIFLTMQAVAAGVVSWAYFSENTEHVGFAVGGSLFTAAAVVYVLWAAVNVASWCVAAGRRRRAEAYVEEVERRDLLAGDILFSGPDAAPDTHPTSLVVPPVRGDTPERGLPLKSPPNATGMDHSVPSRSVTGSRVGAGDWDPLRSASTPRGVDRVASKVMQWSKDVGVAHPLLRPTDQEAEEPTCGAREDLKRLEMVLQEAEATPPRSPHGLTKGVSLLRPKLQRMQQGSMPKSAGDLTSLLRDAPADGAGKRLELALQGGAPRSGLRKCASMQLRANPCLQQPLLRKPSGRAAGSVL